jgi:hydrogenase expression/formation protein HypC
MCLAVPGKIIQIFEKDNLPMAKVDFGAGVLRECCLAYIPEAKVGDYTVIHVGFALNLLSEQDALETLALLQEIADLGEELGPEVGSESVPA